MREGERERGEGVEGAFGQSRYSSMNVLCTFSRKHMLFNLRLNSVLFSLQSIRTQSVLFSLPLLPARVPRIRPPTAHTSSHVLSDPPPRPALPTWWYETLRGCTHTTHTYTYTHNTHTHISTGEGAHTFTHRRIYGFTWGRGERKSDNTC